MRRGDDGVLSWVLLHQISSHGPSVWTGQGDMYALAGPFGRAADAALRFSFYSSMIMRFENV